MVWNRYRKKLFVWKKKVDAYKEEVEYWRKLKKTANPIVDNVIAKHEEAWQLKEKGEELFNATDASASSRELKKYKRKAAKWTTIDLQMKESIHLHCRSYEKEANNGGSYGIVCYPMLFIPCV